MSKQKKQSGMGLLYASIVLCLLASATAIFGLLRQVDTYQESADIYSDVRQQAVRGAAEQTPVGNAQAIELEKPLLPEPAEAEEMELEGENVEDEALFWMLSHQNSTLNERQSGGGVMNAHLPRSTVVLASMQSATDSASLSAVLATEIAFAPNGSATPTLSAAPNGSATPTLSAAPEATTTPSLRPAPSVTPSPTSTPLPGYLPKAGISMERSVMVSEARYSVDFQYLAQINEDVVGWLIQEGTAINYPILRGTDNEYYLNHLLDRSIHRDGSIFMDCGNSAAFIDEGTYVYGHNSKGGGMFASLAEYGKQEYYAKNPQMLLLTPFADYQVDLFAGILTTVDDETSWRLKDFENEREFDAYIAGLKANSIFRSSPNVAPQWGDKLLVLVTCTNTQHGQRHVIYGRMRPITYETSETIEATKLEMDQKLTLNGYKQVGPLGEMMVYAQNDPLWERMRYESQATKKYRVFGQGGCGPTAVAMAIANLVEPEKLPTLIGYASSETGYTFCSCSVNRLFCNHKHAQYHLRTGEEFLRYFPIAIASYAAGNNIWGTKSRKAGSQGTDMRFLENLCNIYRLRLSGTKKMPEVIEKLKEGNSMVISCAILGSPFTKTGHYVVLAGVDEEYVYILDPLRRDDYSDLDRRGYVEILTPGVVRIRIENADKCNLSPFYILEKVEE